MAGDADSVSVTGRVRDRQAAGPVQSTEHRKTGFDMHATTSSGRPRVVIVGCGFGGLAAAQGLADVDVDALVVDRQNHHIFQPLLYQVATAGLNPSDIAQPIRQILRKQHNCSVLLDEVVDIDLDASSVRTSTRTIGYDYLVLATGATHSFFGNDQWAEHATGLKTIDDALHIRRRLLLAFERAEASADPIERRRLMTFVVVGAGPTGVELAGAVKEIAMRTLRRDFRAIDTTDSRVVLVEAGPRVLATFPERLSRSAERQLAKLGVEVLLDTAVTSIDDTGVDTTNGPIPSATVMWGAGVAASGLGASVSDHRDRAGRVPVLGDLSVPGHRSAFVIGDLADVADVAGRRVPGVAPAAQQGGRHVAGMIAADIAGRPRHDFRYRDKGSLATIGRSAAVADLGPRLRFGGYSAWLIWWVIHIWSLVDYRSKLRAMSGWGWQYWTGRRTARLITGIEPADHQR